MQGGSRMSREQALRRRETLATLGGLLRQEYEAAVALPLPDRLAELTRQLEQSYSGRIASGRRLQSS
jgi:hypothetical protein